jgi:hypothetical protein
MHGHELFLWPPRERNEMMSLLRSAVDLGDIDTAASEITVQGDRYPEALEQLTGR